MSPRWVTTWDRAVENKPCLTWSASHAARQETRPRSGCACSFAAGLPIHYAGIDKFFVDKFTAPARSPGRLLFAAVHRRIHCVVIVLRVALDMRRYAGLFQQRPQRLLQLLDVIPHETLE